MTTKDYKVIAEAIRTTNFTDPQDRVIVANKLADALSAAYSGGYSFKRGTFLEACGVK